MSIGKQCGAYIYSGSRTDSAVCDYSFFLHGKKKKSTAAVVGAPTSIQRIWEKSLVIHLIQVVLVIVSITADDPY